MLFLQHHFNVRTTRFLKHEKYMRFATLVLITAIFIPKTSANRNNQDFFFRLEAVYLYRKAQNPKHTLNVVHKRISLHIFLVESYHISSFSADILM